MWETLQESWGSLLDPLHDPVTLAIPAFLTLLILEWVAARTLEHVEPGPDGRTRPPRGGYEKRDARASISMEPCRASTPPRPRWTRKTSINWLPTVKTGLRADMGS